MGALASLYDMLYSTGSVREIDLADYLGEIVASASESLGADDRWIVIDSVLEPVTVDLRRAISIGLIVNELITDSIKYAFPGGRPGRIEVRLARDAGELVLAIEDDGIGLPTDPEDGRAQGFGLIMVRSLAEQLGAEFAASTEHGARFTLRIPSD